MSYQLTPFVANPGPAFVTSGLDGSLWSVVSNSLYWYDDCAWQQFVTFTGGVTDLAVRQLGDMWAIGQSDANVYYFNGVAWALRTLPQGGASRLALGPDGIPWCLDNASRPQIWRFDGPTQAWVQFGQLSSTDPVFLALASAGSGGGNLFLAALDTAGRIWTCATALASWTQAPNLPQGVAKAVAAGPARSVVVIDAAGLLWRLKAASTSWEQLSSQGGFAQLSVQQDGRLLAVDSSNMLYTGVEFYPGIQGFRGSDWNNAGTTVYAVRYEQGQPFEPIYRSHDGITFEPNPCGTLPLVSDGTAFFWFTVPLIIPTAKPGAKERMLASPIGSQTLYLCDDINQAVLTFEPVFTDTDDPGSAGVWNGFADDSAGNVYVGWYANGSGKNKAILYKSSAAEEYKTWHVVASWQARHIHSVRVNPYNGYLYVIVGEPRDSSVATDSRDSGKVMRSKNGGATWTCLTDTWANTPVMPDAPDTPPLYLGLYFSALGFINDRVVLGEDTDFKHGRIFYFDDDGGSGTNPPSPLPVAPQATYQTCNGGEFFLGAASLGDRLYMASQYLAPTLGVASTRCVSTRDGVSWRLEQACTRAPNNFASSMGIITQHPQRARKLLYSLSPTDSFIIANSATPSGSPRLLAKLCRALCRTLARICRKWR